MLDVNIDKILENPFLYNWEYQGFGMIRIYLDKDIRLQIWSNDYKINNVTDIHTHPWDFKSLIVQGQLINNIYAELPYEDKFKYTDNELFNKCLIETGDKAYVMESKKIILNKHISNIYKEGETYYHNKDIPHNIEFINGTITLLTKYNKNQNSLAYSYVKLDNVWVSAAPRPASRDEIEHFVNVAKKLRKK